ncbi:sugar phosphate isomerase/epimerase family protein [Paraburkholderia sp. D1E]|uniref:sugar phosphate isomerase/epimerase family protein n=1 Tax=Paraburkholderia sp. D1E TaxID=3461398 RepID=UPI004045A989
MKKMFPLACAGRGIQPSSMTHPVSEQELPVMEQFRLVAESGLWDFFDRIPEESNLHEYQRAIDTYQIPVLSGSWTYQLGHDEPVIEANLRRAKRVGSKYHNLMVWARHHDGRMVTNAEVIDSYLRTFELADSLGLSITYEVHVDMWSEAFPRIEEVADAIEARGVPFQFCMDYSHCIFKIENEVEQAVSGIRSDPDSVRRLDPFNADSFCDRWLARNMVWWTQVRPVAPNGPRNWWAYESGPFDGMGCERPGRGIQYPFEHPAPGEWHTETWHAHKLACTMEVVRKVIDQYLRHEASSMRIMTIDNINLSAYGVGWKYNMFADSCAVARAVRALYAERAAVLDAEQQAGSRQHLIDSYRPAAIQG